MDYLNQNFYLPEKTTQKAYVQKVEKTKNIIKQLEQMNNRKELTQQQIDEFNYLDRPYQDEILGFNVQRMKMPPKTWRQTINQKRPGWLF